MGTHCFPYLLHQDAQKSLLGLMVYYCIAGYQPLSKGKGHCEHHFARAAFGLLTNALNCTGYQAMGANWPRQ